MSLEAAKALAAIFRDIAPFLLGGWGLWIAHQRLVPARDQARLAGAQQRHELFARCVEQLESSKLAVRLGGIVLLKDLMAKHPDLSDPTKEMLIAYVAERTVDGDPDEAPPDINAIIDILRPDA